VNMAVALTKDFDPWGSGVLQRQHHDRLVANIDQIAQRAGLGIANRHLIWTKAELNTAEMQFCIAAAEMARTNEAFQLPKIGICYTKNQADAEKKMLAMAGLLVRNFVDARVMSRMDIVAERKENKAPVDASVVLVPDFAMPEYIESMPVWEKTAMMEFVHERSRDGLPTCLFVGVSMSVIKTKLPTVASDLEQAFLIES
jgi:hypothetical protein